MFGEARSLVHLCHLLLVIGLAAKSASPPIGDLSNDALRTLQPFMFAEVQSDMRIPDVSDNTQPAANTLRVGVMAAAVALGLVAFTVACTWNAEKAEKACVVQTVVLFTGNLTYTLIVPSSYLISRVVGAGVAYSGAIIGVQQAGATCGAVVMWMVLQSRPEMWRERTALFLSTGCSFLGAILFYLATLKMEQRLDQPVEGSLRWTEALLLFARFVDGLGLGVILQLGQVTIVHVISSSRRPGWMGTNQLGAMLGIGFGPMLASFAGMLAAAESLLAVGMIYVGIAIGGLLAVAACYTDSLANVEDTQALRRIQQATAYGEKPSAVLICAALAMAGMRGFVVSGLEAATSILLEIEYSWHRSAIGLAVGLSFLSIMPLKLVYNTVHDKLSPATWIRVMALLSILGACLLFTHVSKALHLATQQNAQMILVADSILFPTIFLGDALTAGIVMMSQHLFPVGTWLDANYVVVFREICKGIGRTGGPPVARMTVGAGGQDSYALQQVILAVAFLLLLEVCVRPNILPEALDEEGPDE
mmetsp:Transcript_7408/g.17528  ORF Transcript_7408/g.17528 Transcript_7408/m.17528 type:complete len:534 (-) Transcript_7408:41-1642(-)